MMIFNEKEHEDLEVTEEEFSADGDSAYDDVDETEGDALARIKKLKEELKKCNAEKKEYLDGWQRTKADYLNSKKRHDDERGQNAVRSEINLIEKILPLCDSFDMALAHEDAGGEANVWKTGFVQIHSQLKSILADFKVTEIAAEGAHFDPYKHEALSSIAVDSEMKHDMVISVLQKGYMRGDTLLRPAKVVIGVYGE
ncbi:nucleotide exchange factor GrpE [Patescibacteria group bacterium]|jgi:molecular chaperone GrpE|nr:nucleotide exchange factor GrpE [Patescibacteria group bacterium]